MKTKIQILKESLVYIFILGLSSIFFIYILNLINKDSVLLFILFLFLSLLGTSFALSQIFEKDEILWKSVLKYFIIGLVSGMFSLLLTILGLPFVTEWLIGYFSTVWQGHFSQGILHGLLMIIPMFAVFMILTLFGLMVFMVVCYFIGNWLFSFLFYTIFNQMQKEKQE
jgi:hypothetical protein